MSNVGHQYNAMRGSEQNSMIAASKFAHEEADRIHDEYGKEENGNASNFEDTLQRSMLLGDLRMDTSKDVLRGHHNARLNNDMSAFVDQDVSQSTSKLDMSMYGLDSMLQVAEQPVHPLKRPYSPPLKHLTSQHEEEWSLHLLIST